MEFEDKDSKILVGKLGADLAKKFRARLCSRKQKKVNTLAVKFSYETLNNLQSHAESDDFTPERYRQFVRYLPKNCRKILDLGCCTGVGGLTLKRLRPGLELHGFDCSSDRLSRLPAAYQGKHCGDATQMSFPDAEFDAVLMGEFIEHLYPHDVDPCLHEVQRILSVGGRILLTTPNPEGWKKRLYRQTIYSVGHVSQHFKKVLCLRLKMAGFGRIRVYGSGRSTRYLPGTLPLPNFFGSLLYLGDKI